MLRFDALVRICLLSAVLVLTTQFCNKQTDTFTIGAISSNRPYHPEFDTRPLTADEEAELQLALSQPYTYFGRGGQAYALFSADGKYVVKFLKQRLYQPSWILNHLPLPKFLYRYRSMRNWKRANKFQRDFFSYRVSFDELQEETGILYSHLNRTNHLQRKLEIIDRLGIHHFLDLDRFDFIVQQRAERVYDRIGRLLEDGMAGEAKKALWEVFRLISTRAEKGFRDRDPNIRTNCGFIGDRAVKIDVGRFVRAQKIEDEQHRHKLIREEIARITKPFEEWIKCYHPSIYPEYQRIKEAYHL